MVYIRIRICLSRLYTIFVHFVWANSKLTRMLEYTTRVSWTGRTGGKTDGLTDDAKQYTPTNTVFGGVYNEYTVFA